MQSENPSEGRDKNIALLSAAVGMVGHKNGGANKNNRLDYITFLYDSVFGKRVLTYWENRGTLDNSHLNDYIVGVEKYIFWEREKPHLSKNV